MPVFHLFIVIYRHSLDPVAKAVLHNLDQNRQHYDRVSGEKHALYYQRFDTTILDENPIVANLVTKMYEKLFPQPVGNLLDVGCGTGFYYPLLSRHTESIVGVDVSTSMLDEARQLIAERQLSHCSVNCLLYTSPSPRDATLSRMPSSA